MSLLECSVDSFPTHIRVVEGFEKRFDCAFGECAFLVLETTTFAWSQNEIAIVIAIEMVIETSIVIATRTVSESVSVKMCQSVEMRFGQIVPAPVVFSFLLLVISIPRRTAS